MKTDTKLSHGKGLWLLIAVSATATLMVAGYAGHSLAFGGGGGNSMGATGVSSSGSQTHGASGNQQCNTKPKGPWIQGPVTDLQRMRDPVVLRYPPGPNVTQDPNDGWWTDKKGWQYEPNTPDSELKKINDFYDTQDKMKSITDQVDQALQGIKGTPIAHP